MTGHTNYQVYHEGDAVNGKGSTFPPIPYRLIVIFLLGWRTKAGGADYERTAMPPRIGHKRVANAAACGHRRPTAAPTT